MLILICGLPGTGKSYLARELADEIGAIHLNTDIIRKEIFEEREYSEKEKKEVYDKMMERAGKEIIEGKDVILDGTFYKRNLRMKACELSGEYVIIEVVADEDIVRERMNNRKGPSEADFEVYEKIRDEFEEITKEHLKVNSSLEIKEQISKTRKYIIIEKLKKQFELVETHISWVFLGDEFVYKVKKPVKFSFLDFSSLEKRKFYCEEEIRLNKRLSPEIYLGVVELMSDGFEGEKELIDYAVKMKRIDGNRKMDIRLKEGKVSEEEIKEISKIMAKFHSKIETINEGYATPKMVKEQIDDLGNFRETIEEACGMEKEVDEVLERCGKFILENKLLFKKRIKDGRIKDCHGDLHSGNIFLGEKIFVFDCIEFNKDFRVNDVASEMAFMAMDLDYFGREDLSKILVDEYIKLTKDEEIRKIIGLYKCYRANVRAKVAAIGYMQNPDDENKEKIRKYLELAKEYSKEI